MQHSALAAISRSFTFFGGMATIVAGLTWGASLQFPTDESSSTIAAMRGRAPTLDTSARQLAAAPAARIREAVSRQAMAEAPRMAAVLR